MISRMVLGCLGLMALQGVTVAQMSEADMKKLREGIVADLLPIMRDDIKTAIAQAKLAEEPAPKPNGDDIAEIQKQLTDLGNIVRKVTTTSEDGGVYLKIDTNYQPARAELKRAIDSTVPEYGDFVIRNRSTYDSYIIINGNQHLVLAGAELPLKLKPGPVTSRLRHERQPTIYHLTFPKYYQAVEIADRPVPWVYTSQPAYWVAASY